MSLENIAEEITALRAEVKAIAKLLRKVKSKQDDPTGEIAAKRAENNGFNRKQKVSEKLQAFLGVDAEAMVSRSEVTKFINKYITENGLKHPENGRVLVLDDKLRDLLQAPSDVTVTYLNLQKYLSPHYIKA